LSYTDCLRQATVFGVAESHLHRVPAIDCP